jgi:hypothetical protein
MNFLGRWVGRDKPVHPLYFFLWGYVKNIVYETPVTSLDELLMQSKQYLEGNLILLGHLTCYKMHAFLS